MIRARRLLSSFKDGALTRTGTQCSVLSLARALTKVAAFWSDCARRSRFGDNYQRALRHTHTLANLFDPQ